jgi:hypothetical protein
LKVLSGVSLEGSGASTVLENEAGTVIACADGAARVANLTVCQVRAPPIASACT